MSTHLSAEVVAELRRLLAEATPGPWEAIAGAFGDPSAGPDHMRVVSAGWAYAYDPEHTVARMEYDQRGGNDATLIAAAINALPALLDAAEAARETTPAEIKQCGICAELGHTSDEHPAPAPEAEVAAGECTCPCHQTSVNGLLAAHIGPCACTEISPEAVDLLNEVRAGDTTRIHALMDADPLPAIAPADDATPAPAEPKTAEVDAGDVEALAKAVLVGVEERGNHVTAWQARDAVRSMLASPEFAALLDRERRAERERIAQAIEADRPEMGLHINVTEYRRGMDDGLIKALRIARADASGAAGEGTGGAG